MTKWILCAVTGGILIGHFLVPGVIPAKAVEHCNLLITIGLCLILFLVGLDMGKQGSIWNDIRTAGFRVLLVPLAVTAGTMSFAVLASLFLPTSIRETVAASAGLGWYSLAPVILAKYSATLSAIAFLSNVMREVLSIILIPVIAQKIGYVECVALPGAAAMDTVLPVVVKATDDRIAIYSFVSGVMLSLAVPILVPLVMEF